MGINKIFEGGVDCSIGVDFFHLQENIQIFKKMVKIYWSKVRGVRRISDTFQLKLFYFGTRLQCSVWFSVDVKQQWRGMIDQLLLFNS